MLGVDMSLKNGVCLGKQGWHPTVLRLVVIVCVATLLATSLAACERPGRPFGTNEDYVGIWACYDIRTGKDYKNLELGKGYNQYIVIYNNSSEPADITNLIFGLLAPYEANAANAYYGADNVLVYENADWIPACGALWWFKAESVSLPPYSDMVIVPSAAINHTETNPHSVDLSKSDYYWMCNQGLGMMYDKAKKYQVAETIPEAHYLTGKAFASSPSGWPLSTGSPTLFVGKMHRDEALALCSDTDKIDKTLGAMFSCAKFPKAKVVDALEVWVKGNEETSRVRFPADVNSNYVLMTPKLGYSVYRNVDKEATEALPENAGKLVYNYAGGTEDVEGTTDPSGIDAEASIANGAHILYSDTNNSFTDFHQRKVFALKK